MNKPNDFSPAPLWRRFAAMLYDSFLVLALWIVLGFVVLRIFGIDSVQAENGQVVLDPLYRVVQFATMIIGAVGFFTLFWMKSGQTLGMQAWRIKAQNPDGSPLRLRQCLIRCLVAPFALGLLGVGYVWMYFDARRRSWPDRASDSDIVKVPL